MKTFPLRDGYVIQGDVLDPEVVRFIKSLTSLSGELPLITADPPYGRIVGEDWDLIDDVYKFTDWMYQWTIEYSELLIKGGAFYIWGGIGKPGFRPFYKYLSSLEDFVKGMQIANHITWSKKRGYGIQHNYLFTREELIYLCKGDIKKPYCFNVPYLNELRGYPGYDKLHPAKSEYKRRTNVWMDITEILRGKTHECEKPEDLYSVIISTHTKPKAWCLDLFGGSGVAARAARRLERNFIVVEKKEQHVKEILESLNERPRRFKLPPKRAS